MLDLSTTASITTLMRPMKFIINNILLVLLTYGCASQALPVKKDSARLVATNNLQEHVWYDGQKKRTVWLNPDLAADFQSNATRTNLLQQHYPGAIARYKHHSIRIWGLPSQPTSIKTSSNQGNTSRLIPSGYSPVFHDTPTASGRIRALPGNVIVYLNPAWDANKISRWMKNHKLEISKKIEIRDNAYVIKSEPGIHTLQLANSLYESGDVVAAFPDWWLDSNLR